MMRVLVCGGRDFKKKRVVDYWLDKVVRDYGMDVLIEGGARGADKLAREYAEREGIPVETFPANWNRYGRGAGPIRNKQMIVEGRPDLVVAFDGNDGTANMVKQARVAGILILTCNSKRTRPRASFFSDEIR